MGAGVQQCNPPYQGQRGERPGTKSGQTSQLLRRVGQHPVPPQIYGVMGVLCHMPMPRPARCSWCKRVRCINCPEPHAVVGCCTGNKDLSAGPFHTIHFI